MMCRACGCEQAGMQCRAAKPERCLHPTCIHTPLQVLVDQGLKIELFDYDPFKTSRTLGEGVVPLQDLLSRESVNVVVPLQVITNVDVTSQHAYLRVAKRYRTHLQFYEVCAPSHICSIRGEVHAQCRAPHSLRLSS